MSTIVICKKLKNYFFALKPYAQKESFQYWYLFSRRHEARTYSCIAVLSNFGLKTMVGSNVFAD